MMEKYGAEVQRFEVLEKVEGSTEYKVAAVDLSSDEAIEFAAKKEGAIVRLMNR